MAVPKFYEFFTPILYVLNSKSSLSVKEIIHNTADYMHLSKVDMAEMLPSNKQPKYVNRIHWANQYLKNAGLIMAPHRGSYSITQEGKRVLKEDADKLDVKYLTRYPSFVAFQGGTSTGGGTGTGLEHEPPEDTPTEAMDKAYNTIRSELAQSLLSTIMSCTPSFFEHLVVQLLITMGYGDGSNESGFVVGQTGDGGIDGIINEDKLGFSQVYVQAKRWESTHTVGSPDVQAFAGALLGKGATKGLFITTSHFSDAAKKFVADQKATRIVLIDGAELTRLMMDYGVGVTTQRTYTIRQIDTDFFEEQ